MLTEETKPVEGEDFEALKQRALRLLARRDYGSAELAEKLSDHDPEAQQLPAVLDWLRDTRLVDDVAYAGRVVRHYSGKMYGQFRLQEELRRRRIPSDLWEAALAEAPPAAECLLPYLERKLHSTAPKECRKMSMALMRRGFSWEEVHESLLRHQEKLLEEGYGEGAESEEFSCW